MGLCQKKIRRGNKISAERKGQEHSAAQGVAYCDLLFKIERGLADFSPEERYDRRLKQEKPVLDALLVWANPRTVTPKSILGEALRYLKDEWPYLLNYLKDDRLELSNNRAERSIKPFVIDRKNFLFANTPSGTKSSAVIFSLIQTATESGLDLYRYLTWLLSPAAAMNLTQPDTVQSLLPWNSPDLCKADLKA